MRLCKSNIFANKILEKDFIGNLREVIYDADRAAPKYVLCGGEFIHKGYVPSISVGTAKITSEKEFNLSILKCILRGCMNYNRIVNNFIKACDIFLNSNIPIGGLLVPNDFILDNNPILASLKNIIIKVPGLKTNQFIFTPPPNYLGVIAIGGNNLDEYGVVIMAANLPVLVEL